MRYLVKIVWKFERSRRGECRRKGLGNRSLTTSLCLRIGRPLSVSTLSRRGSLGAARCGRAVTLIDRYCIMNDIRSPRLRPFLLERALWKGRTQDKKDETWAGSDVRVSRDAPHRERGGGRKRGRERGKKQKGFAVIRGTVREKRGRAAREIYRMTTMTMTRCGATWWGRRFHFLYATTTWSARKGGWNVERVAERGGTVVGSRVLEFSKFINVGPYYVC